MSGGVWHLVANVADAVTLCCSRAVRDLPSHDGLTENPTDVTCPTPPAETGDQP